MHMHGQSPCYAKAKFLLNSAYDNTSYSAEGKTSQSMNTMGVTGLWGRWHKQERLLCVCAASRLQHSLSHADIVFKQSECPAFSKDTQHNFKAFQGEKPSGISILSSALWNGCVWRSTFTGVINVKPRLAETSGNQMFPENQDCTTGYHCQ